MRPGAFLDEKGAGAHLALATRVSLQGAYGRWLGYLAARAPERIRPAKQHVGVDSISAYVEQLRQTRVGSGIATELHHLRLALKLLFPKTDWSWLKKVTKRIAAQAKRLCHCAPALPRCAANWYPFCEGRR